MQGASGYKPQSNTNIQIKLSGQYRLQLEAAKSAASKQLVEVTPSNIRDLLGEEYDANLSELGNALNYGNKNHAVQKTILKSFAIDKKEIAQVPKEFIKDGALVIPNQLMVENCIAFDCEVHIQRGTLHAKEGAIAVALSDDAVVKAIGRRATAIARGEGSQAHAYEGATAKAEGKFSEAHAYEGSTATAEKPNTQANAHEKNSKANAFAADSKANAYAANSQANAVGQYSEANANVSDSVSNADVPFSVSNANAPGAVSNANARDSVANANASLTIANAMATNARSIGYKEYSMATGSSKDATTIAAHKDAKIFAANGAIEIAFSDLDYHPDIEDRQKADRGDAETMYEYGITKYNTPSDDPASKLQKTIGWNYLHHSANAGCLRASYLLSELYLRDGNQKQSNFFRQQLGTVNVAGECSKENEGDGIGLNDGADHNKKIIPEIIQNLSQEEKSRLAKIYFDRGILMLQSGQRARARALFELAEEHGSTDLNSRIKETTAGSTGESVVLAKVFLTLKEFKKAQALFEEVINQEASTKKEIAAKEEARFQLTKLSTTKRPPVFDISHTPHQQDDLFKELLPFGYEV